MTENLLFKNYDIHNYTDTNSFECLQSELVLSLNFNDLFPIFLQMDNSIQGIRSSVHGIDSSIQEIGSTVQGIDSSFQRFSSTVQGLDSLIQGISSTVQVILLLLFNIVVYFSRLHSIHLIYISIYNPYLIT